MNTKKLQMTPELMHNWTYHQPNIHYPILPAHVLAAIGLQHTEHCRGLSVRESAEKVCSRFPDYLEFCF